MVMPSNAITLNVDLPADNTDVLAGSPLDPIPGPGTVFLYVAASQRDAQLTVGGPAVQGGAFNVPPVLRTNGIPDLSTDMPYTLAVSAGKLIVSYNEVTAGDGFLTAVYIPA